MTPPMSDVDADPALDVNGPRPTQPLQSPPRENVNETSKATVVVSAAKYHTNDLDTARTLDRSIVIMPARRAADGTGVYAESTLFLAKDLNADGIDATFLDDSENRTFEVKHSVLAATLLSLALAIGGGVGTNASWEGLKRLLHRSRDNNDNDDSPNRDRDIEVTVVDLNARDDRNQYTIRGATDDVIDAIERLRITTDRPERLENRRNDDDGSATEPNE